MKPMKSKTVVLLATLILSSGSAAWSQDMMPGLDREVCLIAIEPQSSVRFEVDFRRAAHRWVKYWWYDDAPAPAKDGTVFAVWSNLVSLLR